VTTPASRLPRPLLYSEPTKASRLRVGEYTGEPERKEARAALARGGGERAGGRARERRDFKPGELSNMRAVDRWRR